MSIAGYNKKITSVAVADPGGTLKVALLVAPKGGATIHAAYISTSAAIAASGSNTVTGTLIDGGPTGAGTTSMGSFAVDASTATLANGMNAMTLTQTGIDEGDVLIVQYSEAGTVAPGTVTFSVEWTQGGT